MAAMLNVEMGETYHSVLDTEIFLVIDLLKKNLILIKLLKGN